MHAKKVFTANLGVKSAFIFGNKIGKYRTAIDFVKLAVSFTMSSM